MLQAEGSFLGFYLIDPNTPLVQKLEEVHRTLHRWDYEVLKGPHTKLRELQKELDAIMSGPLTDDTVVKQKELQIKIED